jgi:hypothetical protein
VDAIPHRKTQRFSKCLLAFKQRRVIKGKAWPSRNAGLKHILKARDFGNRCVSKHSEMGTEVTYLFSEFFGSGFRHPGSLSPVISDSHGLVFLARFFALARLSRASFFSSSSFETVRTMRSALLMRWASVSPGTGGAGSGFICPS